MATDQKHSSSDRPNDRQGTDQNSYNKMGMFTFVVSMIASLGVLIYVSFLSGGIDLKEVPDQKAEQKTEQKVPGTDAPMNPEATAAQAAPDAPAAPASKPDGASNAPSPLGSQND